jgi:cytochrome c oxidase subunit III
MADEALTFQYAEPAQQREAVTLGMWAFLATEVLFFGALVAAYFNYRIWFGAEFIAAVRMTKVAFGTINTGVLLTSSGLVRVFACAGFFWLLIMIALTSADYAHRTDQRVPVDEVR